jgi:hypothetical protein
MWKHWKLTLMELLAVLLLMTMALTVIVGVPSAALAAAPTPAPRPSGPHIPDQPLHHRFQLPPPTIPPYTYGAPYSIQGQPGLYVTVTLLAKTQGVPAPVDNSQIIVIPAPPYDPNWSEPWGSFQSYADWANQFRSQNGKDPTMKDEIDFWVSQAMGGALDDLQAAAAQAQNSASSQNGAQTTQP